MADSLRSMITPALLRQLVAARIPFDRSAPLDWTVDGGLFLTDEDFTSNIKDVAFPVLQAISKLSLNAIPDFMELLPQPDSKDFPELCLGLVLLLDQAPRALCVGVDGRWVGGYFDLLSQRFAEAWLNLPLEVRPDLPYRWCSTTQTSFDFWLFARLWFGAVYVHSERLQHQEAALLYTEYTRKVVELASGKKDPYRAKRDEVLANVLDFPRVVRKGSPQGPQVTLDSWAFWACMLMDIHTPIIRKFHRYPYKNAVLGRDSSDEEKKWIDDTDNFAEADPETAKRIREDIAAGRWNPLGESGH